MDFADCPVGETEADNAPLPDRLGERWHERVGQWGARFGPQSLGGGRDPVTHAVGQAFNELGPRPDRRLRQSRDGQGGGSAARINPSASASSRGRPVSRAR